MFKNIVFVGGIHGVGKSTFCKEVSNQLNLNYLSASAVLKWEELNVDVKNKKVEDIPYTQDRLIRGLNLLVNPDEKYLLDGHFCLFDKDGQVSTVPLSTFENINPLMLVVVLGDTQEIQKRLNERDNKGYSVEDLNTMQKYEVEHSILVSKSLGIRCLSDSIENSSSLLQEISMAIKSNA